ncbi:MAG TPA: hypothetical protein QF604_01820, partial [Candidatus Latescibacteria bacterium]|nr:hypothetical protein [Candidatus Latescibacterota bacterium]
MTQRRRTGILKLAAVALLVGGSAWAQRATTSVGTVPSGYVFNIVDWDGGQLPPLYERSQQLPMSLADIIELTEAGFADSMVAKMVQ